MDIRLKAVVISHWPDSRILCGRGNYIVVSTVCDIHCFSWEEATKSLPNYPPHFKLKLFFENFYTAFEPFLIQQEMRALMIEPSFW